MIYRCCDENRRAAVIGNPNLNGIDYLEVLDHDAVALGSPRQQTLMVHLLRRVPASLTTANVMIVGGESITGIGVEWLSSAGALPPLSNPAEQAYFAALADAANVLIIRTNKAGDFSTYTLRLVNDTSQALEDPFDVTAALTGFDPQLAEVQFSFKVECGPHFDCLPQPTSCPPPAVTTPPINYLAKDYGSFRTILLDRLNQLLPSWNATSEADLGVALAELVAFVGDRLSYQQDAIATEAYMETARSRISLRRHALLVDYPIHDGCNARAWIHLKVASPVFMDRSKTRFYTFAPNMPSDLAIGSGNEEKALLAGVQFFEPMQDAVLYPEHNQMTFYTWGDKNCCLPAGAIEATLAGTYPNLHPGDVLIFQEVKGPQTGVAADADIRNRFAVRLTQVSTRDVTGELLSDPLFESGSGLPITAPSVQTSTPVTEIQWSSNDALPFALCLSSTFLNSMGDQQFIADVSVVLGNVVLADHGLTLRDVDLGTVPTPSLFWPPDPAADCCKPYAPKPLPARFRPVLPDRPITQAVLLPLAGSPETSSIVMLSATGVVNLTDSKGIICLTIQAVDVPGWPQYFGLTVAPNAVTPANFDIHVIYTPPGGAVGVTPPVVLEILANLSLNPADPNYAPTQINHLSRLISVPTGFSPTGAAPTAYPALPTMLPSKGTITLIDAGGNPYLTIQPTTSSAWPQLFGVIAQGNQTIPDQFNLLVLYDPPTGGVGVSLPVVVEQFNTISLATTAAQFNADSRLISVISFADAPNASLSAYDLMNFDASDATPAITLQGTLNGVTSKWTPEQNLLESAASDRNFVVEVESTGAATLRFGDGINAKIAESGTAFLASYRVGNGTPGNVGAESLVFMAANDARIQSCTNPLSARGGVDPETGDQIRRRAPQAFFTQQRAVTMSDYAAIAERNSFVEQSVATLRWTGSWYTVFLANGPNGGGVLSASLSKSLKKNVERYHLAGQDLQLQSPQYVSLQITLQVCVDPTYFRSHVAEALLKILSNCILPGGQKGMFYPDNFTFGQTVYLSPIYSAVRSVAGVTSVTATTFQPQGVNNNLYLASGEIKMSGFQIARLDNDPSFPGHGQLTLVLQGGK